MKWLMKIIILQFVLFLSVAAISAVDLSNDTITAQSIDENNEIMVEIDEIITDDISISNDENNSMDANMNTLQINRDSVNLLRAGSDILYVSPTGTGDGLSIDSPTTWTNAIGNINVNGKIYFLDGNYEIFNQNINKLNLTLEAINPRAVVISANGKGNIFNIRANGVKIIGLTLRDSNSSNAAINAWNDFTVINSVFINNTGTNMGGALYSYGTINITDSIFINNTAKLGGAVYTINNVYITNSEFKNNTATTSATVYSRGETLIINSNFTSNNVSSQGGAVASSKNITVYDSVFKDNVAGGSGSAIIAWSDITVINCLFNNNTSIKGAGVLWNNYKVFANNSNFTNNVANTAAGAINSQNVEIYYSNFVNNTVTATNGGGGAVSSARGNVFNSTFINNTASVYGGAIQSSSQIDVTNSEFIGNSANYGGAVNSPIAHIHNSVLINNSGKEGGAIYSATVSSTNYDIFINNTGEEGGAIYSHYINSNSDLFVDNSAGFGGAVYTFYGEMNNTKFNDNSAEYGGALMCISCEVANSNFTNNNVSVYGGAIYASESLNMSNSVFNSNHADYIGGSIYCNDLTSNKCDFKNNDATNGGAICSSIANITNSNFTNNRGFDGAAMDVDDLTVDNCYFSENNAKTYGIIYTVNGTVTNSVFEDSNNALNNILVYALNELTLSNNVLPENEYILENTTPDYVINITSSRLFILKSGLIGYCTQKTYSWVAGVVYLVDSLDLMRNQITGEYVGEYLKLLIYSNPDNYRNLTNQVWTFTDTDFRNSNDEKVKEVLRLYDSGFRVPTHNATLILNNGQQVLINFLSSGRASDQNLFLFDIKCLGNNYNMGIEKISLNKTVYLGEQVMFDILVKNNGDTILNNIRVTENEYDDLVFDSWYGINGDWSKEFIDGKHVFILNRLYIGQNATFRVIFNTTTAGFKVNTVIGKSNETNNTNSSNNTTVYHPNLEVRKITLNKTVFNGEQVLFDVVVSNTGDCSLSGVFVEELSYDGLTYAGFNGVGWIKSGERFMYQYSLDVGRNATFTVIFNTSRSGNFTNVVVAGSNQTGNKTGNNTTTVYTPDLVVRKITLNKTVLNGEQVLFDVVVTNIGDCSLSGVFVEELSYDGLTYAGFNGVGWVNQNNRFVYLDVLDVGRTAMFTVIFNTSRSGNFTNVVVAGSNQTGNKTGNNTTTVYTPDLVVRKITLNKTVLNGEQVLFDVVVSNTGDCSLSGVFVEELSYDGLTYAGFNGVGWIKSGDRFFYSNSLGVGESVGFTVIFNTSRSGNFTNVVVAGSNQTGNKTGNNTTTVYTPDLVVRKITLNKTVLNGEQVLFDIVVGNTGDCSLSGVFVEELSYDGLTYAGFNGVGWIKSGNRFLYQYSLDVGRNATFTVIFNTSASGNFTNVVVAGSNQTGNKTGNNTTTVYSPDFEVIKISNNPKVNVGKQTVFTIIVRNTGDIALSNIRVFEENYDGLTYHGFTGSDWTKNGNTFTYTKNLAVNETTSFTITFNTTRIGKFTNTIVATSNNTQNKTTNNTTEVHDPKMIVEKITLNPFAKLGDIVEFEIIVRNVGDLVLHDVTVIEYDHDGLEYVGYSNKAGSWNYNLINNKHAFILADPLTINDTVSFIVRFKTLTDGILNNTVVASSNETGNITANNKTEVKKDDPFTNETIEKSSEKVNIEKTTGNPFALLLLGLLCTIFPIITRKK